MQIRDILDDVRELKAAQGWENTDLEERLNFVMEEANEVSETVLGLIEAEDEDQEAELKQALGHEIYDVVWNLFDFAVIAGIDLEAAFAEKQALNKKRTWRK